MTGLTETEHVVAAFQAGGVDYVTKPIRAQEVLARMAVHVGSARQAQQATQARNALDAFGHATMAIQLDEATRAVRAVWQTPLARRLMHDYFGVAAAQIPEPVLEWLRTESMSASEGSRAAHAAGEPRPSTTRRASSSSRCSSAPATTTCSSSCARSPMRRWWRPWCRRSGSRMREAEVLYWVAKGKTNRDIGDILGSSPATVKKHLERVYVKLGVETRTAAASTATARLRQLQHGGERLITVRRRVAGGEFA